jgi:hypothetical protein
MPTEVKGGPMKVEWPDDLHVTMEHVFSGEWRVGFVWRGIIYRPGVSSYYPLREAVKLAYQEYLSHSERLSKKQGA